MGYMEGNLSGVDYTYAGGTAHYPLWKPPSGYFPRGEAPPPYEEAVAVSQAETLSTQCNANAPIASNAQRALGINSVEATNNDIRRNNPPQQTNVQSQHALQLHHPPSTTQSIQHVGALHSPHQQSNQITQSTTNLINININSGGNVTTIATGENHQPPFSLQNESINMLNTTQEQQHLQQQNQLFNGNNMAGRLHLAPNNSICVQTITAAQQQNQMVVATPTTNSAKMLQHSVTPQQSLHPTHHQTHPQQPNNCQLQIPTPECNYKNCHLNISASINNATQQRHLQRTTMPLHTAQDILQQYVTVADVDIKRGVSGYHSLSNNGPTTSYNTNSNELDLITSPTQFSNNAIHTHLAGSVSTHAIDVIPVVNGEIATISTSNNALTQTVLNVPTASGHHTLPNQHTNSQIVKNMESNSINMNGSKTPSTSRRYHRTIPRYFAIADPLSAKDSSSEKIKTDTKNATTTINTAGTSTTIKKPTCQCPIQHVPMSYMGSNQINNAQNVSNTAFLSALSTKLTSSTSSSSSTHSARSLGYAQRAKSSSNIQQLSNDTIAVGNGNCGTVKRNSQNSSLTTSPYCSHEPRIATISKQVGDIGPNLNSAHHHSTRIQSEHHEKTSLHQDDSPMVLGRVHKKSNNDRLRSSSSGSGRTATESNASVPTYLNGKVDAYLTFIQPQQLHSSTQQLDEVNPVLPPKLHKSLMNLKAPPTNIPKSQANTITPMPVPMSATKTAITAPIYKRIETDNSSLCTTTSANSSTSTTSVQTIYTFSKLSARKDNETNKNNPPSLTLPLSPAANGHTTHSSNVEKFNKINSSTFYPLQNNHVTYTLPKNINGKVSLNSTIATVMRDKVPSVISIPVSGTNTNNNIENNNSSSTANNSAISDNCTTRNSSRYSNPNPNPNLNSNLNSKCTTLPKIVCIKKEGSMLKSNLVPSNTSNTAFAPTLTNLNQLAVSQCNMPTYPQQCTNITNISSVASTVTHNDSSASKHLPVCTTSKNCLNPKEHFLPNDTSLDDDYLSECENCKIAQSAKYYLNPEVTETPQETMTLQRKSMEESKEEQDQTYYRISHTLPTNTKKTAPNKNNNREPWFSTIPASSSSEEEVNE